MSGNIRYPWCWNYFQHTQLAEVTTTYKTRFICVRTDTVFTRSYTKSEFVCGPCIEYWFPDEVEQEFPGHSNEFDQRHHELGCAALVVATYSPYGGPRWRGILSPMQV